MSYNASMPVILGARKMFRNIERQLLEKEEKEKDQESNHKMPGED